MELVKLLLKLLYLAVLFVLLHLLIKPQVQLTKARLAILVLSVAILVMHFTFEPGYNFIAKNEIVIQSDEKNTSEDTDIDEEAEDEAEVAGNKNSTKTEIVDKVHKEASSNYLLDHTHKFVQNKVFG